MKRSAAGCSRSRILRPDREESHVLIWPEGGGSPEEQMGALYAGLREALEAEGDPAFQVRAERLFLAGPLPRARVEAVRGKTLGESGRPPSWMVVQPPCAPGRFCELQAIVSRQRGVPRRETGAREIHLMGVEGRQGGSFLDEAMTMFEAAEEELQKRGAAFRQVVRTWIHLADMRRDYADLNRARRLFIRRREIPVLPASTGIGGPPVPGERPPASVVLSLQAVPGARTVRAIRSSTLNEAPEYGSDFSRGVRVEESGGPILLHISGTSAVDEAGRSVAPGDFEGQVDRMLLNVESLLAGQGAGLPEVKSAVSYLQDRSFLGAYLRRLEPTGLLGVPHPILEAEVCRPELLCELEVVAAL